MALICTLMAFGLGTVVAVAANMMLRDGGQWRAQAEAQRERRYSRTPSRGALYDRNGDPLALTVKVPTAVVDAKILLKGVSDDALGRVARDAAERIASALGLPRERVQKKLMRRGRYALLKRGVSATEAQALRKLTDRRQEDPLRGLVIQPEPLRFYPARETASSVVGFVSPDGEGKSGVELTFNETLKGGTETWSGLRDRRGKVLLLAGYEHPGHLAGHNVELTLDASLQRVAERELALAVKVHQALSASVVVVDPATGELIAIANYPTYNPNDVRKSRSGSRRNRAIADRFEPGSTMKAFTMAAALAEGVVKPGSVRDCQLGHMRIGRGAVIRDTHPASILTMTEIMAYSSNICIAKIAMQLGEHRLHSYFRNFGFGERTEVPLPGETAGTLRPQKRPWYESETAWASFGQGISVTNLQMAMGMAALANDGRLMEPRLIRRVVTAGGEVIRESVPHVRRQVVPASVTAPLTEMLVAVTGPKGTAQEAAIDGYRVAGKTGTAEKAGRGGYVKDDYVASFAGFVPADAPRFVIAVMVDEPRGQTAGGSVAAPVFRKVASAALRLQAVPPRGDRAVPWKSLSEAETRAEAALSLIRPDAKAPDSRVPELSARRTPSRDQPLVPDVMGWPARSALGRVMSAGIRPNVVGTGVVVDQIPPPGAPVQVGDVVSLILSPQP